MTALPSAASASSVDADLMAMLAHAVEWTLPLHFARGEPWCYLGYVVVHVDCERGLVHLRKVAVGEPVVVPLAELTFVATLDGRVWERCLGARSGGDLAQLRRDGATAALSGLVMLLSDPTLTAAERAALRCAAARVAGAGL